MDRNGIPTMQSASFDDADGAKSFAASLDGKCAVKADGLALGKGVLICNNTGEANRAIDQIMTDRAFGEAGSSVLIQELITGMEVSLHALCDGKCAKLFPSSQDHKRALDGDEGLNTGGMGAYSPAPVLTDEIAERALAEIIRPTMAEMAKRGTPYQGVLYAGLMIKDGAPRLVEYNARFGDPECQVLMMRLGAQAFDLMHAAAEGRLNEARVNWADDHAVTVVMAAQGYPGSYDKGSVIKGLDALPEDSRNMVFHAGTAKKDGAITAIGGRVLNVTARGDTLAEAQARAYEMVEAIDWPGGFYRRDIGWRALS